MGKTQAIKLKYKETFTWFHSCSDNSSFSKSYLASFPVSCRQTNVTLLADLRVSDGNWHQVTVVRTSQNLSLVVDKSVRATAPLHQPFSFLDKPLILNSEYFF